MRSPLPRARRTTRRVSAALWAAGLATLGGCEGAATVATPSDSGPAPGDHAPAPPPAAPAVRETTPRRSDPPPTAPRRTERSPERRETAAGTDRDRRPPATPMRGNDAGSGVTKVPGAPDPFDPEIDPSTLTRPEPVAPPAEERPPELLDVPLTAPVPPDKQAIPADLALPVGAVLYYQDGRDWIEVELKTSAPPLDGASAGEKEAASVLRVHRTDRPAVIPDVRIARDQLIVTKLTVRRLRSAR